MMRIPLGIFIILIFFAGCTPQTSLTHRWTDLNPQEAQALLETKDRIYLFVLNVHTPYQGKIEGTDAIIEDWQNITVNKDQLPQDLHQPILVYCRTGRMSTSAVAQLQDLGYKNIYHLKGGMIAWDQAGLPLVDKAW